MKTSVPLADGVVADRTPLSVETVSVPTPFRLCFVNGTLDMCSSGCKRVLDIYIIS